MYCIYTDVQDYDGFRILMVIRELNARREGERGSAAHYKRFIRARIFFSRLKNLLFLNYTRFVCEACDRIYIYIFVYPTFFSDFGRPNFG